MSATQCLPVCTACGMIFLLAFALEGTAGRTTSRCSHLVPATLHRTFVAFHCCCMQGFQQNMTETIAEAYGQLRSAGRMAGGGLVSCSARLLRCALPCRACCACCALRWAAARWCQCSLAPSCLHKFLPLRLPPFSCFAGCGHIVCGSDPGVGGRCTVGSIHCL
jgi:hypothetical protein